MLPRLTPIRMLRLCLKELRESLRDRRTIVTLVLMPLLVYPLLSLILNRVLLTSVSTSQNEQVTLGVGPELHDAPLAGILTFGYAILQDRQIAPVYTNETVFDRSTSASSNEENLTTSPIPVPQLLELSTDGREALRNGSVDLLLVRRAPDDEEDKSRRVGQNAIQQLLEQFDEGEAPTPEQMAGFISLVGRLEVRYRKGDRQSELALSILERMMMAVNNEAAHGIIGGNYEAPYRMVTTPVVVKNNYADLLATMVPLVLVLMTMAGAVYPAIDLTAGERERGTMEALIVSPTPSYALLLAKYSAVVTVALLTALANLAAMTLTLWVSGIGKMIFGDGVLSAGVIGTVLVLLVLFTMFFAALLLAVTSFAKSFKEAQAYLIPLMLLALTPGVMSLLPGIKFTGLLATVPLVNIVLLARQVLVGSAEWNTAIVAIICTGIYAIAALAVASRLFGSDASMHGSQGSWRDLLMRPAESKRFPGVDQMALTMAVMFPLYFIASSLLPAVSTQLGVRLWMSALVSFLLILGLPVLVCLYRRIEIVPTFLLRMGSPLSWLLWLPAIVLIAGSAWMAAHEIFIFGQEMGLVLISDEHIQRVTEFRDELRALPLPMILFVFAITPAVCEEVLFRGFVLSSLNKYSRLWAILLSSLLFGLMHVLTSNVLAVERFLPTTFMGLLLGWVAVRTGSLWPGMILHAMHNGLLLSVSHFQEELKEMQILVEEGKHLPQLWLIGGAIALVAGLTLVGWQRKVKPPEPAQSAAAIP